MKIFNHLSKFLFGISVLALLSFSNKDNRHIGEWTGTDNAGKTATLVLDSTNHVKIIMSDQVLGGDNFEVHGQKTECKYEIDYSHNPIWIDIIMYNKTNLTEMGRLKGIIMFITDTKMKLRLSYTDKRDKSFDPSNTDDTIVLDKKIN